MLSSSPPAAFPPFVSRFDEKKETRICENSSGAFSPPQYYDTGKNYNISISQSWEEGLFSKYTLVSRSISFGEFRSSSRKKEIDGLNAFRARRALDERLAVRTYLPRVQSTLCGKSHHSNIASVNTTEFIQSDGSIDHRKEKVILERVNRQKPY